MKILNSNKKYFMKYRSLTNFFLPLFLILFFTSCADIIDAYFYSNPDENGLLNKIWEWFQLNTNPLFQFLMITVGFLILYIYSAFKKKK